MATFIFLVNLTDEGVKKIKEDTPNRSETGQKLARDLGGTITANYLTMGLYDRVVICDFPDGDAAAKFALSIGSRGFARTTTLRGFNPDEQRAILAGMI